MLQSILIEFPPIVTWYCVCLALGLGMFPLTFVVFHNYPDRGFSLTKILGLFGLSYVIWLSTSLGITRYHRQSILIMAAALLLVNGVLLFMNWREFWRFVRRHILLLLSIEAVFLVFFLAALVIRMYSPDITGAEKEADFTLLNAVLHSEFFPPKDTWFAGSTLNYYYGGYLMWATMIHLTGVIAPIGFNLAVITIVALSATGAFGLGYAFTHKRSFGVLSAILLVALGNLDGLMQMIQRGGKLLPFNWWQSSRVIPDTINEFPFFSFLLGDLHAHFMSIPGIVLLLGLLGQLLRADDVSAFSTTIRKTVSIWFPFQHSRHLWLLLALITLVLGGTSMINSWDYPTCVLLTGACLTVIFVKNIQSSRSKVIVLQTLFGALGVFLAVVVFSRIAYWPFYQHFTAPLGLGNLRFVAAKQRTGLSYFLVIYGVFLCAASLFFIARFLPAARPSNEQQRTYRLLCRNGFALLMVVAYLLSGTWVLPLSVVIAGILVYLMYSEQIAQDMHSAGKLSVLHKNGFLPYLLVFMAFAIIAGCELLYIKDFYGHPLERQNTIFKFYYQAWIFLAIGTPYLLARFSEQTVAQQKMFFRLAGYSVFTLLCMAGAIYPVFATYERAGHFRNGQHGGPLYLPTLNGISYIAYRHPQEFEALVWIQNNVPDDAVILEATGNPYSFFGRVSSVTGRSTVLGWGNHEALWRDQSWKSITQRTDDIKRIYDSVDKSQVFDLLRTYAIGYVYVGKLEKESYAAEGLREFGLTFQAVYTNAFVTMYQVPDAGTP